MTRFEQVKKQLTRAALSEDITQRTSALEMSNVPGFFDGFTEVQIYQLKTIKGDIWSGRAELALLQAQQHQTA